MDPLSPSPLVALSIAGYDPSAGAGVLADIKTFAAHDLYGMAAITALTVQSTQGVRRCQPLAPALVLETLDALAADVRFDVIKIGMLGSGEVASAVLAWLESLPRPQSPIVLDPVLCSSSGHDLLDASGLDLLRGPFLAQLDWVTPNLPELARLTGRPVPAGRAQTEAAAAALLAIADNPGLHIVVTGGHADPPDDLLFTAAGPQWHPGAAVPTRATHGTGCAFSSALAAALARGAAPSAAVQSAKEYVAGALLHAAPIGLGNGPIHHFWRADCPQSLTFNPLPESYLRDPKK